MQLSTGLYVRGLGRTKDNVLALYKFLVRLECCIFHSWLKSGLPRILHATHAVHSMHMMHSDSVEFICAIQKTYVCMCTGTAVAVAGGCSVAAVIIDQ